MSATTCPSQRAASLVICLALTGCSAVPEPASGRSSAATAESQAGGSGPGGADGSSREADATLRVCADPNNLPFSNERGEGFENAIAELVARELGRTVQYTWWPQRRGFIRNTLQAGRCDVVMGLPADYELARTTRSYYRSTYVFVTRRDGPVQVTSLDDDILRRARLGIHVIGDDYANVPPAQALAKRGIVENIRGYSIYGDYSKPNPPASLIDAVASGDVDIALAWGPLAGYFASRQSVQLRITPMVPERDGPVPFIYDISMGVRRDAEALHQQLDEIILKRQGEIDQVLQTFRVPLVSTPPHGNSSFAMRPGAGRS